MIFSRIRQGFSTISVVLPDFKTHKLDPNLLPRSATTNPAELIDIYKSM